VTAAPAALLPGKWALLSLALAAAALTSSVLLWQRLGSVQEELARRSLDASAQSIEARTLARQAQEGMLELSGRLAMQETRISEVSLQRTQLEELMQSLSRSRDENLVVDMESALRLAQQQAQLTGSAEPLIAALRSADQRLSRAAQPRLGPLQRAITRDLDRIKAATVTDVPLLMLKLDEWSVWSMNCRWPTRCRPAAHFARWPRLLRLRRQRPARPSGMSLTGRRFMRGHRACWAASGMAHASCCA
jgi:uroporphyrin-3 C-methyltransferase